ncbi:hypothetical protein AB0K12_09015 [Nonomuraea sp. NPDC049419]|uniref:YncE family protein n=1 Tax=Nonomuraea sp. NPDC049419 TaxID=3155772 RepID=UPI00343316AC
MMIWVLGLAAISAAAMTVSREMLTRFATLSGYPVTMENAPQVIDYFSRLRRRRLAAVVLAVPVAGLTGDPFYLVAGWCTGPLLAARRVPFFAMNVPRALWLTSLTAAALAGVHLVVSEDPGRTLLPHAAVALAVAAAVTLADRRPRVPDQDQAARALAAWSARNVHLAGSAVVLASVLLAPGRPPQDEPPGHNGPAEVRATPATFETVDEHDAPTCPWFDETVAPCRFWQVNGEPFPQAALYVAEAGKAPRSAPFAVAPNRKAVVYLHAEDRRLTYQDAGGSRPLTPPLADADVPTVTFKDRFVIMSGAGAQIVDTRTWTPLMLAGARKVHDVNAAGVVVTKGDRVLVLDLRGRVRMRLPAGKRGDDYHLRPDGRRLVVIRWAKDRAETYDPATGKRLSAVTYRFPGEDWLENVPGWSKGGRFLLHSAYEDRSYSLDLATGKLTPR